MVTNSSHQNRQQPGRKAPISSHPAFPVIVALWFAALLGIGSLIVPAALLEKLVTVTGLNAIVSSAEPPLGDTARTIIALLGAGVGTVSGLLIARKVIGAHTPSGLAPVYDVKVPISAMEELGALSFDQAIDEDPSLAPQSTSTVNDRLRALIAPDETDACDLSEPTMPQNAAEEAPNETVEETQEEFANAAKISAEPASHHTLVTGSVSGLTTQQLIAEPLNQLGIVQLVERFALSLQHNAPAVTEQPLETEMADSKDAAAEVLNQPSPSILPLPEALRPIEYDFDPGTFGAQDENYLPALDLKALLAKQDQAPKETTQANVTAQNDDGSDVAGQSNYAALRRFDPPAAISAAETSFKAEINPEATERALRDALEKLQKMSGVG